MDLKQAIEQRMSVRNFTSQPVPEADLREMVRLANLAPSVNNSQPWKFIAITNHDLLKELATLVDNKIREAPLNESGSADAVQKRVEWFSTFFRDAPALIAVAMQSYQTVWEQGVTVDHDTINAIRNYPDIQSLGACIENLLLAAVDMNYGGCWLSAPMVAKDEMETILQVKKPYQLAAFVAIGKPASTPRPHSRKSLETIFELFS